jgi:hypothetical protein
MAVHAAKTAAAAQALPEADFRIVGILLPPDSLVAAIVHNSGEAFNRA